ncbi:MAG TPA: SRPBCC family protein [Phototrophicaceae bacterium]|nr:SRPBCC family protein [Phototrophicaceae bacterium]
MTVLERSVLINASPATIDAFAADIARWPEWYPGVEQIEGDGTFPKLGGSAKVVYQALGQHLNITFTSVEYNYEHSLAYKMDGMITGTVRFTLTPEGSGTRVTGRFEYELPGGGLGKIFDRLVVERLNAENMEKSLANMKAKIEG